MSTLGFNDQPLKLFKATVVIGINSTWPIAIGEVVMLPDSRENKTLSEAGFLKELPYSFGQGGNDGNEVCEAKDGDL